MTIKISPRTLGSLWAYARKLMLSVAAFAAIFWLALHAPRPFGASAVQQPPPEAEPAVAATHASAFLVDGVPLATESWSVDACDAVTWTPVDSHLWTESSLLLDLDRSPGQVLAVWLDVSYDVSDGGNGASLASGGDLSEASGGTHHAARLLCGAHGRGEVVHTWLTAPANPEELRRRLEQPVTEREGPVPLLPGAVQLLHFRNLDWSVYLDQPADPSTAVERLHLAMQLRGWSAKDLTAQLYDDGAGTIGREDLSRGRILIHADGGLCLLSRTVVDRRDLMIVTCRGLS